MDLLSVPRPLEGYELTIWAAAVTGLLSLIQLLVADAAAIKAGHPPGTPIPADSRRFLFRAARAHANTNESVAVFAIFAVTGIALSASPAWLGGLAWLYVGARGAHMVAYYANLRIPRSSAFAVSLVALGGMFASVASAAL